MIIMKVIVMMLKLTSRLTVVPLAPWLCTAATAVGRNVDIIIIITGPKPAYGRQGLDWIIGPGYSFVVFSTNKIMETNQRP